VVLKFFFELISFFKENVMGKLNIGKRKKAELLLSVGEGLQGVPGPPATP
jgi:hypothetical protein